MSKIEAREIYDKHFAEGTLGQIRTIFLIAWLQHHVIISDIMLEMLVPDKHASVSLAVFPEGTPAIILISNQVARLPEGLIKFILLHEDAHIINKDCEPGSGEMLFDDEAEMRADAYAIEHGADPVDAIGAIYRCAGEHMLLDKRYLSLVSKVKGIQVRSIDSSPSISVCVSNSDECHNRHFSTNKYGTIGAIRRSIDSKRKMDIELRGSTEVKCLDLGE